jgi:hypothetical protein
MMRKTYYASDGALVRTVTKGAMLECPVTGKDVRMATDIYGRDGYLKLVKWQVYGCVMTYNIRVDPKRELWVPLP